MCPLETLASKIISLYGGKETEHNWEKIDSLLKEYTTELVNYDVEVNINALRRYKEVLQELMLTERTRLAITILSLLSAVAVRLGSSYDIFQESFLYPLLKLCERSNKIISEKAKSSLIAIIKSCPHPPKVILSKCQDSSTSPNKQLKLAVFEVLCTLVQSSSKESLNEQLEILLKTLSTGLQDAADTVRSQSRVLYNLVKQKYPSEAENLLKQLPAAVVKTLGVAPAGSSKPPNFRSFMSQKQHNSTLITSTGGESRSSVGPQRIQRPTTPNMTVSSSSADLAAKRVNHKTEQARLPLPTRFARSTTTMAPQSSTSYNNQHQTKLPPSHSTGNLTSAPSAQLKSAKSEDVLSKGPYTMLHTSSNALPSTSFSNSNLLSTATVTPRSILSDFKANVSHPDWNYRQKALVDFVSNLESISDLREYLESSQSKIFAIFDIFERGTRDAHHQVVAASLDLGLKLTSLFSADKHPDPVKFASSCIFRIYSAATNIQFKARTSMLESCHLAVEHLLAWINLPRSMIEVLAGSLQFHEHLFKPKLLILGKLEEKIRAYDGIENESKKILIDLVRRNCALLLDKDANIVSSFKKLAILIAEIVGSEEILSNVSNEAKSLLKSILPTVEHVQCTPLASPMIETNEITLASTEIKQEEVPSSYMGNRDEIVVDSEITMRLRTKRSPPCTPKTLSKSISVVDFDTPRSTEAEVNHETDPEEEADIATHVDEIIEEYSNPLMVDEPVNAIKHLDLS